MSREIYGVIYRVKNKINNKVYIGQTTVDFRKRYEMSRDKELSYGLYMYHLKHSKIKQTLEITKVSRVFLFLIFKINLQNKGTF